MLKEPTSQCSNPPNLEVFLLHVDECLLPGACLHGRCVNLDGSHRCSCNTGYQTTPDGRACEDVDECATPVCPAGICTNTEGSYSCKNCRPGFQRSADGQRCEDVDECSNADMCLGGVCANTEGSFTCTRCKDGYKVSQDRHRCEDVDECLVANVCPGQLCRNSPGSFSCRSCGTGFTLSEDGSYCQDINECLSPGVCPMGVCSNTEGSYSCMTCDLGFTLAPNGLSCEDINECEDHGLCLGGQCTNSPGSYSCSCPPGLEMVDGTSCRDVDECQSGGICGDGDCLNTEGSYLCICPDGYTTGTTDGIGCQDQNECKEFGSSVCGTWRCENTIGSYRCFMGCQPGLYGEDNPDCVGQGCRLMGRTVHPTPPGQPPTPQPPQVSATETPVERRALQSVSTLADDRAWLGVALSLLKTMMLCGWIPVWRGLFSLTIEVTHCGPLPITLFRLSLFKVNSPSPSQNTPEHRNSSSLSGPVQWCSQPWPSLTRSLLTYFLVPAAPPLFQAPQHFSDPTAQAEGAGAGGEKF
ncbi:unnamed protein product [Coregonus sp. 'balchen']|nr:unnamed protein product [Coregonus sp. 'balchen']